MHIPNPDSPNLMPDSFANAGPELRAYMTGRSPFEVREPSYASTREDLRSKIDSQDTFSRTAGRERPELPQIEMTEPTVAPLSEAYQMIREAEAKIQEEIERNSSPFANLFERVQRETHEQHEKNMWLKSFKEEYGLY